MTNVLEYKRVLECRDLSMELSCWRELVPFADMTNNHKFLSRDLAQYYGYLQDLSIKRVIIKLWEIGAIINGILLHGVTGSALLRGLCKKTKPLLDGVLVPLPRLFLYLLDIRLKVLELTQHNNDSTPPVRIAKTRDFFISHPFK